MFNSNPVFQLAGEAQELFSVRHGPVRAARILPAPHISEYPWMQLWVLGVSKWRYIITIKQRPSLLMLEPLLAISVGALSQWWRAKTDGNLDLSLFAAFWSGFSLIFFNVVKSAHFHTCHWSDFQGFYNNFFKCVFLKWDSGVLFASNTQNNGYSLKHQSRDKCASTEFGFQQHLFIWTFQTCVCWNRVIL